jgi:hypothetical protein
MLARSSLWFRRGCNVPAGAADDADDADDAEEGEEGGGVDHQQPVAHTRVFDIPDAIINDVGSRLLAASSALNLKEDFRSHAPCESLMLEACDGGSQRPRLRHLRQQLSIAGHLQLSGGLTPRHVIVEFGAGKAGLSRTLCRGHPSNTCAAPFHQRIFVTSCAGTCSSTSKASRAKRTVV